MVGALVYPRAAGVRQAARDERTIFEGPTDWAENYGTRLRGYVTAPLTGNCTFWIASDDNSELYLSTSEDPANKAVIASVASFTGSREWTKYTSQTSAPQALAAGRRYYIEVLQKEGAGGDNVAVGWQRPGGTYERPIPGFTSVYQRAQAMNLHLDELPATLGSLAARPGRVSSSTGSFDILAAAAGWIEPAGTAPLRSPAVGMSGTASLAAPASAFGREDWGSDPAAREPDAPAVKSVRPLRLSDSPSSAAVLRLRQRPPYRGDYRSRARGPGELFRRRDREAGISSRPTYYSAAPFSGLPFEEGSAFFDFASRPGLLFAAAGPSHSMPLYC